jgi:hypothetical protein
MTIKIIVEIDGEVLELTPTEKGEREFQELLLRALNTWEDPPAWARTLYDKLRAKLGPKPPKMIHPCECRAYNGRQCYNCLNGAHDLCDAGCKVARSKQVGVMIVTKE